MAQKKTSTGRTAVKKPSTSSRSGGTKKKTASTTRKGTGSRASTAKKAPAKSGSRSAASSRSTSARTNTAARSGGSRAPAPRYERPMARQIGGAVLVCVQAAGIKSYKEKTEKFCAETSDGKDQRISGKLLIFVHKKVTTPKQLKLNIFFVFHIHNFDGSFDKSHTAHRYCHKEEYAP